MNAEPLRIAVELDGDVHAFNVVGELDHATADTLRSPLDEAIASGAKAILIDLSDCPFIDSTGLSVLVHARKRMTERYGGGRFGVCCPDANVRRLLEITGLDRAMGVVASRDEALSELSSR